MLPNLFWWNPTIYLPLSGPVTQDILPMINTRLATIQHWLGALSNVVLDHSIPIDGERPLPRITANVLEYKADTELVDPETKKKRIAQTKALLDLIRSLDPDEFARIVKEESSRSAS